MEIKIKKVHPEAVLPAYQNPHDAGFDFYCIRTQTIPAESCIILPTGLAMAVPEGYELQIRLRSSVARNTPLIIPNAPGTVDSGYRGEIGILIRNLSRQNWNIEKGERIAQGVIAPVTQASFILCESLPASIRGRGGFGSTGKD